LDPEAVEKVEAELDQFIERRARQAKDAEKVEGLWAETDRADQERRNRENRAAWYGFHCHMQDVHASLAADHEAKAMRLLQEGGTG
jgi:hypothetical protein